MRVSLFLLLFVGAVWAQDETTKPEAKVEKLVRGIKDGKFVDEYFGLVYEAKELAEGFGMGDVGQLFAGKCAGGVEVEVIALEVPKAIAPEQLQASMKQQWAQDGKTRTDIEHGTDPRPWSMCVEESLAGFKRHKAWAFYTRGVQGFIVQAQVQEKSDTSGDALKAALFGLTVSEKSDSFFYCHVAAKRDPMGALQPNDPKALMSAAGGYMDQKSPLHNVDRALQALALAEKHYDSFNDEEKFGFMQTKGLAVLTARKLDNAVELWLRVVEMSKKTARPADMESNSRYNLACAYSLKGDLDNAFDQLKQSLSMGSDQQKTGLKDWAPKDPDLEPMRKDPRWAEMFGGGAGAGG